MFHTLLSFGAMWTMISSSPNQVYVGYYHYYTELSDVCENRAGSACCRASVMAMRREGARPVTIAQGCDEGQKVVSLPCPASLTWCRAVPAFAPASYQAH